MIDTLSRRTVESHSRCLLGMKLLIMEVYFIKNLYFLLTCCIGQSPPWAGRRFSASQEILRILWNPKVHCRIHKCPSPIPILDQLDPVHTTSHFLKICLNIILQFTPETSPVVSFFRFPHQDPVYTSSLPHTCYLPRLSHSARFDHTNNTGWRVRIIKLIIM